MKSSPLKRVPRNAPNTLPGATLRWSSAKPVTSESQMLSAISPRFIRSMFRFVVNVGQYLGEIRLAAHVGPDTEHRRDPADGLRHHRRDVPAGGAESEGFGGGLGLVEHDDDHIARLVHRENAGEG